MILKKGGEFGNVGGNRISKMIEFNFLNGSLSASLQINNSAQQLTWLSYPWQLGELGQANAFRRSTDRGYRQ